MKLVNAGRKAVRDNKLTPQVHTTGERYEVNSNVRLSTGP